MRVGWECNILGYSSALYLVFIRHTTLYMDGIPKRTFTVTVTCHYDIPHECYSSKTQDGCMCVDREGKGVMCNVHQLVL